jgi:hypothetical protein
MNTILFKFDELSNKDKVAKKATDLFAKTRSQVAQVDVSPSVKKQNGIAYRELFLLMADSQRITFRIKESGDIFQVLMNDKLLPIKYQDDHTKAVKEISNKLEDNRAKFQKTQAANAIKIPPTIKTAAPKMIEVLTTKRDELKVEVEDAQAELAELQAA